ncbi:MAG: DUF4838 domain-containing protein [bacterium]
MNRGWRGFCLVALLLASGCASPVVLTKNNAPASTIVIGAQAAKEEVKAASVLQQYIFEISGAKLPIQKDDKPVDGAVISVGNTTLLPADIREKLKIGGKVAATDPGRDAIAIAVRKDRVFLAGHNGDATLFSVYDFLEGLGCRWFFACKAGTVIPRTPTLQLEKREALSFPDFAYRNDFSWDSPGREGETRKWREANKINEKWVAGTSGHNFFTIWPESLYDAHPEYFPLINGKRVRHAQRCLSNPGLIKLGIEWADKTLQAHPEYEVIPFICNDGEGGHCQCTNCTSLGNFGDQTMYMANEVGKELFKKYPDKQIQVYSYYQSARAIKIKADGYDEGKDRVVVDMYSNYALEPWNTVIESWGKASHHLIICEAWPWIYWSWGVHMGDPVSYADNRLKQYPFYKTNHALGISTQVRGDWAIFGFSRYLSAKLKWNVNADVEKIKQDFCEKMFPNAQDEFYCFNELYDEKYSDNIDLTVFLQRGFYFLDKIRHKIRTEQERERWEFYALYLHERSLALKFEAIENTDRQAKLKATWKMISFIKGIEDWGVLDSRNWVATFYAEVLKNALGEKPSADDCPEMPAMEINSRKIEEFFDQDRPLYKTSIPIMQRKPLI